MTNEIELYEEFFQKRKSYYLDKWAKLRNGQKFSFNVFAFLFGLFWFMYRKMYIEAIIVFVAIIAESFLEELILTNNIGQDTRKVISIVGIIVIATIIGFLGNYFYLRKADRIIQVAKKKYTDNEQQKIFLKKKGGISFIFLIIILVIILLLFAYNNYRNFTE